MNRLHVSERQHQDVQVGGVPQVALLSLYQVEPQEKLSFVTSSYTLRPTTRKLAGCQQKLLLRVATSETFATRCADVRVTYCVRAKSCQFLLNQFHPLSVSKSLKSDLSCLLWIFGDPDKWIVSLRTPSTRYLHSESSRPTSLCAHG